ncbi:MAG: hypothetical protein WBC33_10025 [Conexibacter sp.]
MESPAERSCPSCAAPAQASQRWCLECGAELRSARRAGLRPAVGIATTLALLVGAASAGGYTLLQDGKQPPPPATTVAQQPPPATATTPPATQEPSPYTPPPAVSSDPGSIGGATSTGTTPSSSGTSSTSSTSSGGGSTSDSGAGDGTGGAETPDEPQLALTDVALGAVAVVYAPYTPDDVDLGDASRVVDGTTRTVWKAPASIDPTASPQVGVYVDLASREEIKKLVIRTPTPGIGIEIYGARTGPPQAITDEGWDHVATRTELEQKTTIKLPSRQFRYLLVWITEAPPDGVRAAISELSLLSLQPE